MKELWIIVGFLSMGLGALGIVLPILPTTPFFLITAYAFSKGSHRFSKWFHDRKFVRNYLTGMKMTRKKKWILNFFVDGLCIAYFVLLSNVWIRIVLVVIVVIKHYVFYKFVTVE